MHPGTMSEQKTIAMKHSSSLFSSGYDQILSSCQKNVLLFSSLCNIFQSLIDITPEKYNFSHYYAIYTTL